MKYTRYEDRNSIIGQVHDSKEDFLEKIDTYLKDSIDREELSWLSTFNRDLRDYDSYLRLMSYQSFSKPTNSLSKASSGIGLGEGTRERIDLNSISYRWSARASLREASQG
jgi:hypothetical protein